MHRVSVFSIFFGLMSLLTGAAQAGCGQAESQPPKVIDFMMAMEIVPTGTDTGRCFAHTHQIDEEFLLVTPRGENDLVAEMAMRMVDHGVPYNEFRRVIYIESPRTASVADSIEQMVFVQKHWPGALIVDESFQMIEIVNFRWGEKCKAAEAFMVNERSFAAGDGCGIVFRIWTDTVS